MEETPKQQNQLDKYGLTANEINYTIIDPQNGSQLYNLPQEILLLVISFMQHPVDAFSFMLVCKSFFLPVKQYDQKIFGNLTVEKKSHKHTLIEIADTAIARKKLVGKFNEFLHTLFSSTKVTPVERSKILQKIAKAILNHQPINFTLKGNINIIDRKIETEFVTCYNLIIKNSPNDNPFENTISDLVETMRRVEADYHPLVTPLRLHSRRHYLIQSELSPKKNQLAQKMVDKGEITYSEKFELTDWTSSKGEIIYSKGFELPKWIPGKESFIHFALSLIPIAANTILELPYFIAPFQKEYNKYYAEMTSINCTKLFASGGSCEIARKDFSKVGNCTNALNFYLNQEFTSDLCYLQSSSNTLGSLSNCISGYALPSLAAGAMLTLATNHKTPYLSLIARIFILIPGAAFNIVLPHLAQQTSWSTSTAYYAGCAGGCGLDSVTSDTPYQPSSYIFSIADNINPISMSIITTAGVLVFNGILALPKIYASVQDWMKRKNLSDKLQENPGVKGLLKYGTFAPQEERKLEPIVINVEDSDYEMSLSEEENTARCGSSCTLF